MIRNCIKCNKEFKTYECLVKVGKGKYCSKECAKDTLIKKGQSLSVKTQFKKGCKPWSFKGFRLQCARKNGKYYKEIFMPTHPNSTSNGYVREHRLVMENHIGRLLRKDEIVHHIDGNTLNNETDNLELLPKKIHDRNNVKLNIHRRWEEKRGGLDPHTKSN